MLRAWKDIENILQCLVANSDKYLCFEKVLTISFPMLQVYCGPVPQIDNGFAVAATNVSYRGMASYQCYAGFGFPSGNPIETIVCTSEGDWSFTPVCQGMKMKFLLLHLASSSRNAG